MYFKFELAHPVFESSKPGGVHLEHYYYKNDSQGSKFTSDYIHIRLVRHASIILLGWRPNWPFTLVVGASPHNTTNRTRHKGV